jgi:hypothetical protein
MSAIDEGSLIGVIDGVRGVGARVAVGVAAGISVDCLVGCAVDAWETSVAWGNRGRFVGKFPNPQPARRITAIRRRIHLENHFASIKSPPR